VPATALNDRMLRSLPPNTDTPDLLMPGLVARKRDRCVMRQSSGFSGWVEALAGAEHGPQDGDASSCQCDEGLGAMLEVMRWTAPGGIVCQARSC